MKKTLCIVLCLLFCISVLAGCGLSEDEKGPNIRVYLSDFPQTLDPIVPQLNSDVEQILSLIFEPLTTIDENGKVQPALATEWYYKYDEIYQLHKMYFKLKETKWSDNRAVSADDVIYAWRRILDSETDSPYAALLYPIKGARDLKSGVGTIDDLGLAAVDDTLLEITFDVNYDIDLFAETVANIHLAPQREDIVTRCEKSGEDWAGSAGNIVCNGPFRIQSMDMPREKREDEDNYVDKFACKLVLERNAYYMRTDKEDIDKYVTPYRITCYYMEGQISYYPDESGLTQDQFQANRYNNGELYYIGAFDKTTYEFFKKNIKSQQTLNGLAFYFNTENEILKDANVRKALSAAIDRTALAEVAGTGEVAATGFVPTGVFNTNRKTDFRSVGGNLYNVNADEAKAKEYLSSASVKSGTLTVTYLIPENAYTIRTNKKNINYDNVYENVAKAAGEYWRKLGFTIEYRGLNPEDYTAALIARDYDILAYNVIEGSVNAFGYLAPFAKEFSGTSVIVDNSVATTEEIFNTHYTNIDSKEYNELIASILNMTDRTARAEKLHEAEEMLVNELCPATMVYWYTRNYVASSKISGYDDDSWFGYIDFTDLTLKSWRKVNASEDAISEARNDS